MATLPCADYAKLVGHELGVSDWIAIDQDRIDRFADSTGDHQFIHVDPERARASPFGSTIAHGFLILSLMAPMGRQVPTPEGVLLNVNYGLNKVRFITPVPVGSRIRGRFALKAFNPVGEREVQATLAVTVEIEGWPKPALVAEWLIRRHFAEDVRSAVGTD
ncbi:MaoC family dehydratase [Aquabacter sp. L1I39]|uniref:MaoC family dehydratase n=1 Tax=Aquabacter sp. L1I39 TaxID=2820278 RepID=UPI001ADB053E|nr:MaoC family dehydratase [Aquabacter sp. L1I39]QTL03731.1 MaoC family dehydratase [Aquabacter sp. L1I39]